MELEKVVQEEFNKIVENGTVQKIIADNLEKTIKDIISNSVRSYSDFGKSLEAVVSKALDVDMSRLQLLEYNTIVTTIIREELDKSLYDNVREPIIDSIREITGVLEKKEYKLSEVIDLFIKDQQEEEDRSYSGEITLDVEYSSYGYKHINFDKDPDRSRYNCAYQIDVDSKGQIYSFKAGKYIPTTSSSDLRKESRHGSSFDTFIFKLWANKCVLIVDEDDCQTDWCND